LHFCKIFTAHVMLPNRVAEGLLQPHITRHAGSTAAVFSIKTFSCIAQTFNINEYTAFQFVIINVVFSVFRYL
jgi:hypothetical protein